MRVYHDELNKMPLITDYYSYLFIVTVTSRLVVSISNEKGF